MNEINMGNLYEINKEIMKNEKPIDAILANQKLDKIANKMRYNHVNDSYYLLICPDLRQYVFFHVSEGNSTEITIKKNLSEVLNNRGIIYDIDDTKEEENIWEIWIKDIYDNELYMYQLTDYTDAVVEA